MPGWHRLIGAGTGCGTAVALALAVLVGSAPDAQAVDEGEIVSGCTFSEDAIEPLKEAIATALGLFRDEVVEDPNDPNETIIVSVPDTGLIATPIVIVPSFNDNLGQPNDQVVEPDFTGIVVCRSQVEVAAFQNNVSETDNFPSSGLADLLELQQTSYVLIEPTGGGLRSLRLCHTDRQSDCFVADEAPPAPAD
jgi:hypothetical protein